MVTVAIAYCSGAGHTRVLAQAIADAVGGQGDDVLVLDIEASDGIDWSALHSADAIIFGTPTFMGNVAAPFKAFMDASSDFWNDQLWKDKIAAGFTVGSSPSGDKTNTLTTLAIFAAQHGMVWVGQSEIGPPSAPDNPGVNTDGFWLGYAATSSRDKSVLIDPDDLETARRFGVRIAQATRRWVV